MPFIVMLILILPLAYHLEYNPLLKQVSYFLLMVVAIYLHMLLPVSYQIVFRVFLVLSVATFFLLLMCGLAFSNSGVDFYWVECFSFTTNPRFLNHFHVVAVPVIAACAIRERGSVLVLVFLGLVLVFFTIIASFGRGVWVSLFSIFALLYLLFGRKSLRMILMVLVALAVAICVFLVWSVFIPDVGGGVLSRGVGSGGRIEIWGFALERMLEKPWLGWGAYAFGWSEVVPSWMPAHPHQIFLQIAFEYGVPLALFVFIGMAMFFCYSLAFFRREDDFEGRLYLCVVFGLVLNSQYSGVFTMPLGQFLLVLMVALLLNRMVLLDPKVAYLFNEGRNLISKPFPMFFIGCVTALCLSIWFMVFTDYARHGSDGGWNEINKRHHSAPRTWSDGS